MFSTLLQMALCGFQLLGDFAAVNITVKLPATGCPFPAVIDDGFGI
jgi:hypothetical protein